MEKLDPFPSLLSFSPDCVTGVSPTSLFTIFFIVVAVAVVASTHVSNRRFGGL